jgi:hypothetical protein
LCQKISGKKFGIFEEKIMTEVKKRIVLWLLNLLSLAAFAGLLIWSLIDRQIMLKLFSNISYYLIMLLVVLWFVQTVIFLREISFSLKHMFHSHWLGIAISFVLTVFVFLSVKPGFRTLSDETNLLSISRSMTASKTVLNCTMAKYYYGNLNPIIQEVDKRPLVFPFLVNLLHSFTGFRHQNGFVLNFIVMFLFLSGVFIATKKRLDGCSAAAAMLFVVSYPVFTIFGTSAGFDVLNSVFFVLVLGIAYCFIKSPSSAVFSLLISSLLVFANIRYESFVFLLLIPLLLITKIKWQYIKKSSFLIFAAPLVNLPYVWSRLLKPRGYFESAQETKLFSLDALTKNIASFFSNLLDFKHILPYAGIVTLLAFTIIIYLVFQMLRRKVFVEKHHRHFAIILIASVSLSSIMYLAHFMGQYKHPSTARFFITLSICFALSPVVLRVANPQLLSGRALLLFAALAFIYYHPIAVEGRFINQLTLNRQTSHSIDFLKKLDDRNILVVSSRPGQYVSLGYGAVDFDYANKNVSQLMNEARRHLYSKIIVFQEIMYETGMPSSDTPLESAYNLKRLREIQITAESFLRISEVLVVTK